MKNSLFKEGDILDVNEKARGILESERSDYIPSKYHYSNLQNSNEDINPIEKNEKGIDYLIGNDPGISKYSGINQILKNRSDSKESSYDGDNLESQVLELNNYYPKPLLYKVGVSENYEQLKPNSYLYELKVVRARKKGYGPLKKFCSSSDVYDAFHKRAEKADREEFLALLLDSTNYMLGFNVISLGTLDYVAVHPREVFKPALLANAASIILAHNHPSGNTEPSKEDIAMTKTLKKAGELLGIKILDHVIIGDDGYFSFADEGIL